jgi:hypothetical protein
MGWMTFRTVPRVLAIVASVASLVLAMGCEDEEDDCINCCECSNDGSDIEYRPDAPGDCSTCEEQCQILADREFLGQEFDHVKEISCPDD